MKVKELAEKLNLKWIAGDHTDREIHDCYICDMLSYVMAKAKENDAWITVQTNGNVVAVASLADCACVIIPEDIVVEAATIEKANKQGVIILGAHQTAFEIACAIGEGLNKK